MSDLVRIGVSLEQDLLTRFDELLDERGVKNRSEALRDMIRDTLVDADLKDETPSMGSLTLVYDHSRRELSSGLTSVQHAHGHQVISSMHVHVDETHCLEVIVLKGTHGEITRLADHLLRTKGVLHGKLVITSVEAISGRSAHEHHHHHEER